MTFELEMTFRKSAFRSMVLSHVVRDQKRELLFVSDTLQRSLDREGLGESRTETRQGRHNAVKHDTMFKSKRSLQWIIFCLLGNLSLKRISKLKARQAFLVLPSGVVQLSLPKR